MSRLLLVSVCANPRLNGCRGDSGRRDRLVPDRDETDIDGLAAVPRRDQSALGAGKLVERGCDWFRARGVERIEPFQSVKEDVVFACRSSSARARVAEAQASPSWTRFAAILPTAGRARAPLAIDLALRLSALSSPPAVFPVRRSHLRKFKRHVGRLRPALIPSDRQLCESPSPRSRPPHHT